ncbi:uncharacterized protein LOC108914621 [Anoplophora glabripennis]|uniref:uncharacterized protein LOC108914621 n=1 Tax=Anoplophora glabripennis TaxID=217634 RepID=UPI000873EC4C|nr:uncharacterized protein LOC108914621 [Anoplophora glabripennis]
MHIAKSRVECRINPGVQCAFICTSSYEESRALRREKRFLLFEPEDNFIQLIIGVGIPVEIKSHAVVFGWAYRAVYGLPTNLSELMPMDYNERKKRSASRWDIYQMMEQMSEVRGLGGRDCILRAICEAADNPVDKYNGFFEELVHTLFTPTTTNEDIGHHTDNQYYAAQDLGRNYRGKCTQFFPECRQTFLDIFTRFYDSGF